MFALDNRFVDDYRRKSPSFGFNGLGAFVFARTYSRNGEKWVDVCKRVIEGMYSIQETHAIQWSNEKAQRSAQQAFDSMFHMRWTPPGRGLWMMGTDFIHNRGEFEALNNCAFISSEFLATEKGDFFRWLMEMSMLGVGVGFDVLGAGQLKIEKPDSSTVNWQDIPDTREGWAYSVQTLFESYLAGGNEVVFDYDEIRPEGTAIAGFGGVASGPAPLKTLHDAIRGVLDNRVGSSITSRDIVDICNMIGRCVISGNVRRSAEIAIGHASDTAFVNLKNYELNPERAAYGWVSNNSVYVQPKSTDYEDLAERTWENGEPGFIWLHNVHNYGRMGKGVDTRDYLARGFNPCVEQPLWHREMCTLVEIHLSRINTKKQFTEAVKAAYLYGKSVTLTSVAIKDSTTRDVMVRNRRIGLSLTGQQQFVAKHGLQKLIEFMNYGYELTGYYDDIYSDWLGVSQSIRRTSVKPSGTVSLLSGSTPGVHFPISRFYIRRVTLAANSNLVDQMMAAGYQVEPSVVDSNTVVVEFPVDAGEGLRAESEVGFREQMEFVALAQKHWSDNGVSATIKFDKKKDSPKGLAAALREYESRLKAISFLPNEDHGYAQAPYESISGEEYSRRVEGLKKLKIGVIDEEDMVMDEFCDSDTCEVPSA